MTDYTMLTLGLIQDVFKGDRGGIVKTRDRNEGSIWMRISARQKEVNQARNLESVRDTEKITLCRTIQIMCMYTMPFLD